ETESRAHVRGLLRLPVGLEHILEIRLRDAGSCVIDSELDEAATRLRCDSDPSTLGCELECVADEVAEHLNEPVVIGVDRRKRAFRFAVDRHPPGLSERTMAVTDFGEKHSGIHQLALD